MGSQGKTRYLTIILLVTFILLSFSNAILAQKPESAGDCKTDGTCKTGEPRGRVPAPWKQ
ncbi:hypothetical protein OIU74_027431 [Salix koriyanagi]|uniref:Uncharacterized protein n=1 Tax=Salix koriyanagi TaxID=2511006 RepID=A0A9Q0ZZS5_9ROSI|nr:hypothetical protein OIU74_027431 [Salix koriyanagi]